MTLFEKLSKQRDEEMYKARTAAHEGENQLAHFHSMAAIGFARRLEKATVEELEEEVL